MTNTLQQEVASSSAIVEKTIDSFEFCLQEPITYAFGGERVPANSVTIHAPGLELLFDSYDLIQMVSKAAFATMGFMRNITSHAEERQILEEVEEEEDSKSVLAQSPSEAADQAKLYVQFSDIRLKEAIEEFRKLAIGGCVRVNKKPITHFQWKEFRNDDLLSMFLQFLGVFILPSIFPESQVKTGKMIEGG